MRTTLDVDDDVLAAAKEIARSTKQTIGQVVSDLARTTLIHQTEPIEKNGIPQLPRSPHPRVITMELVNRLRDESP